MKPEIKNDKLYISGSIEPVELFEVVRFAAQKELYLDGKAETRLAEAAKKLGDILPTDIRPGWRELMTCGKPRRALEIFDSFGAVDALLPEVAALKGVEQPPQWHPEGDCWIHTMLCLDYLELSDEITATAALLHDVGKPPTFEIADRIRFNKHEAVGAKISLSICKRLGYDEVDAKDIAWIIRSHMKFKHIREMRPGRLKNFVVDRRFEKLAAVVRADCLASHGDTSDIDYAVMVRAEALRGQRVPRPLLTGRDLIEMGYRPGPEFGKALAKLSEAMKKKKVKNKKDAKIFIKNFMENSC